MSGPRGEGGVLQMVLWRGGVVVRGPGGWVLFLCGLRGMVGALEWS